MFGIEVSAQAALEDGTVVAELVIQIPRVSHFYMRCNNQVVACTYIAVHSIHSTYILHPCRILHSVPHMK